VFEFVAVIFHHRWAGLGSAVFLGDGQHINIDGTGISCIVRFCGSEST
jgi:hypothetical protein